ncbi:DUF3127 domain-containing protein [Aquiflexum sp.]|uniref:DUF3127 domain-containing protein n=1 Tax=Aquiflexum sp. TaxID=1872584 RepID=UPI003593CC47
MELSGKIVQILPEQGGTSAKGNWRKRDYILELPGTYPKKVCLTVWGDQIDQFNMDMGDEVNASVDIESREYNGRWYTDVKAWKVEKSNQSKSNSPMSNAPDVTTFSEESGDDVLPF